MSGTKQAQVSVIDAAIYRIGEGVESILNAISHEGIQGLEDSQLLAIDAWVQGGNAAVTHECKRRAEQGRLFAAYLGKS